MRNNSPSQTPSIQQSSIGQQRNSVFAKTNNKTRMYETLQGTSIGGFRSNDSFEKLDDTVDSHNKFPKMPAKMIDG